MTEKEFHAGWINMENKFARAILQEVEKRKNTETQKHENPLITRSMKLPTQIDIDFFPRALHVKII